MPSNAKPKVSRAIGRGTVKAAPPKPKPAAGIPMEAENPVKWTRSLELCKKDGVDVKSEEGKALVWERYTAMAGVINKGGVRINLSTGSEDEE